MSIGWRRLCVGHLMLWCIILSAMPRAQPLVGVGAGRRLPVDLAASPWRMIGLLQTDGGTRCTAFLVAPSVIRTAAHCLYIRRTGHLVIASHIHFLLGYTAGTFRARAVGRAYILHPGCRPDIVSDCDEATIILDHEIGSAADLLRVGQPVAGSQAMLAGYEQDRAEIAIADESCHILGVEGATNGLIEHDCAGTHGASGAPLLVRDGREWKIAGIAIAARAGRGGVALRMDRQSER